MDFRGWQCKTFKPFLDSCSFLLSIPVFLWHKLKETPLPSGPSHQLHLKQEKQTQIICLDSSTGIKLICVRSILHSKLVKSHFYNNKTDEDLGPVVRGSFSLNGG